MKNVDRNGKLIKGGIRVEFNMLGLPVKQGTIWYDPKWYGWHFVTEDGDIHACVVDWEPGKRIFKRIFKYYEVIE
jgi:hypothetical protein